MLSMLLIFVLTIGLLLQQKLKPGQVFALAMLLTYVSGNVTDQQVISSVGNTGVLTLVLLLLCSLAIEKTSLVRWLASKLISSSYRLTWLKMVTFTTFSSAFVNNTAVVSTMISPIRNNPLFSPSKLLLPLSFAAILGGTLTLIGTSTNLIVNSMLIESTGNGLSFFEFTQMGLVVSLITLIALFFVSKKLPKKPVSNVTFDQYLINAKVQSNSSLIGKTVADAGLRHLESLFLVEIARAEHLLSPVSPQEVLQAGDRLVFSGDIKQVSQIEQLPGISMEVDSTNIPLESLTEVVVRPDSVLVGTTLKKANFRSKFDAAVIAIKRDSQAISGKLGQITLQAGDYLVLVVGPDFVKRNNVRKNFITLAGVEPNHRLKGIQQPLVLLSFAGAILLSAFSVVSFFKALFVLLALYLFCGVISVNDIKQRLPLDIWLIVSAAITLSYGLGNSGLLSELAVVVNFDVLQQHPYLILISIYLVTLLITEMVTNNAAAALMLPLALAIAEQGQWSVLPFVMAIVFAANASFISPYSYQTNLLVYNAGKYRLNEFIKAGWPVSLVYSASVLVLLPYFFPL